LLHLETEVLAKPLFLCENKGTAVYGLLMRTGSKTGSQSAQTGKIMLFHIIITDSQLGRADSDKVSLHNLFNMENQKSRAVTDL
jgi:hypothetical protein